MGIQHLSSEGKLEKLPAAARAEALERCLERPMLPGDLKIGFLNALKHDPDFRSSIIDLLEEFL